MQNKKRKKYLDMTIFISLKLKIEKLKFKKKGGGGERGGGAGKMGLGKQCRPRLDATESGDTLCATCAEYFRHINK